jgi:hypothetical protein
MINDSKLLLAYSQHVLGLYRDAENTFNSLSEVPQWHNLALEGLAKVKSTVTTLLNKEKQESFALLEPEPEIDPTVLEEIMRNAPNETYVEFLERMEREREQKSNENLSQVIENTKKDENVASVDVDGEFVKVSNLINIDKFQFIKMCVFYSFISIGQLKRSYTKSHRDH